MKRKNQNETLLWLQFMEGNRDAFATIYHDHIHSLIHYGHKICSDKEVLKDSIQDLFMELWNSRKNLAVPQCIDFYLFRALRNKLMRKEKYRANLIPYTETEPGHDHHFEFSVEDHIVHHELADSRTGSLQKAIATLSSRQQEAIQLRFYHGFTHAQIAQLMQMNYQSVSNLIYGALQRLRIHLKSSAVLGLALLAGSRFWG